MPDERTVHIVDDDAAVRRSLERLLESMEFATVSYPTPEEFLLAAPHLVGRLRSTRRENARHWRAGGAGEADRRSDFFYPSS